MDKDKDKKNAEVKVAEKSTQKTVKEPKAIDKTEEFVADCTTHRKQ